MVTAHQKLTLAGKRFSGLGAVRELEAVTDWNPEDLEAHYALAAVALKTQGQVEEATREMEVAQKLNPKLDTQTKK
jgi:Flp pilus assembly protein TadD